jgi:OOP family OmpA-OmpF porin
MFFGSKAEPRLLPSRPADSDGDGVGDDADRCPGTQAGTAVDESGCPRPQDGDKDGVMDADDRCPATPAGIAVDARGCDADVDRYGVKNEHDQCPATAAGATVDSRGCEVREEIRLPGVQFESDSDRLRPGAQSALNDGVETLKRNPGLVVEVAGYTDDRGNADYNLCLSVRRAKTVHDFLIDHGVRPVQLTWRGYGEADPIAENDTAEGRDTNRRVVLRVIAR